jgi:DNA-directed RNA polymerase subunit RPC12/RpoP
MKDYSCLTCNAIIPVEDDYDTAVVPYCPCSLIVQNQDEIGE